MVLDTRAQNQTNTESGCVVSAETGYYTMLPRNRPVLYVTVPVLIVLLYYLLTTYPHLLKLHSDLWHSNHHKSLPEKFAYEFENSLKENMGLTDSKEGYDKLSDGKEKEVVQNVMEGEPSKLGYNKLGEEDKNQEVQEVKTGDPSKQGYSKLEDSASGPKSKDTKDKTGDGGDKEGREADAGKIPQNEGNQDSKGKNPFDEESDGEEEHYPASENPFEDFSQKERGKNPFDEDDEGDELIKEAKRQDSSGLEQPEGTGVKSDLPVNQGHERKNPFDRDDKLEHQAPLDDNSNESIEDNNPFNSPNGSESKAHNMSELGSRDNLPSHDVLLQDHQQFVLEPEDRSQSAVESEDNHPPSEDTPEDEHPLVANSQDSNQFMIKPQNKHSLNDTSSKAQDLSDAGLNNKDSSEDYELKVKEQDSLSAQVHVNFSDNLPSDEDPKDQLLSVSDHDQRPLAAGQLMNQYPVDLEPKENAVISNDPKNLVSDEESKGGPDINDGEPRVGEQLPSGDEDSRLQLPLRIESMDHQLNVSGPEDQHHLNGAEDLHLNDGELKDQHLANVEPKDQNLNIQEDQNSDNNESKDKQATFDGQSMDGALSWFEELKNSNLLDDEHQDQIQPPEPEGV